MNRLDFLLEDQEVKSDIEKLKQKVDRMYILKATLETKGWTDIIDSYIKSRLNLERFLSASKDQRDEVWGALNELYLFVRYLNKIIEDGEKAIKELNKREEKL